MLHQYKGTKVQLMRFSRHIFETIERRARERTHSD